MFRTTLRGLWAHKRRLISTCIAVILGVAFMSGTLVLNSTLGSIFDDLFGSIGKGIDAQVRGPVLFESETGGGTQRASLDEAAVDEVAAVPGVAAAEGSVGSARLTLLDSKGDAIGGTGPPTIVGSWDNDEGLSSYQVVEGRAPAAPGEAIIDRNGVNQGEFEIGDDIELVGARGPETLQLVGISMFGQADSAGGSIFVGTTLDQAQDLTAEPDKVDTINARAEDGVSPEELVERIEQADVASEAEVITGQEAADEQASDVKEGFSFFTIALSVFAGIALFVGWFIINNTFSILVAQRTRELALMRAIGASRRQVLGSVLGEAGLIGLFSGVVGFGAGVGLAAGALAALRGLGVDLPGGSLVVTPATALQTIGLGVVITAVAALFPAIRATRVAPVAALRDVAIDSSGRSKLRTVVGVIILLLGLLSVSPAFGNDTESSQIPSVGGGLGLLMIAVLVLSPVVARPLAAAIGSWIPLVKGVTGRLARENAMRSPRRTASTASAIVIGVTLVSFISIFASSAQASINAALDNGFKGDYIIQPANQFSFTGAPPALADAIAGVDGVRTVSANTFIEAQVSLPAGEQKPVLVGGIDPATVEDVFDFKMAQGRISALEPGAILVDRAIAEEQGIVVGDDLDLLSAEGKTATFTVAAISDDPAVLGQWTIDRSDTGTLVAEPNDFLISVRLDDGVSVDSIRSDLRAEVEPYANMKLQDREQYSNSIAGLFSTLLNAIFALLLVSIVIALIGVVNTLSLSIYERTRELGLLRAMGMTRSQMRSSVRWEAVIVSLMGTGIGIGLGVGLSYLMVRALVSQGINTFDVSIPFLIGLVALGAVLGVVAAVWPAYKASKLNILEAISTE